MCLILNNLHNSAINLFLNDEPPSVKICRMRPKREIISLYKIWATSSADVVFVVNASTQRLELSTMTNMCLNFSGVTDCGGLDSQVGSVVRQTAKVPGSIPGGAKVLGTDGICKYCFNRLRVSFNFGSKLAVYV